MNTDSGGWIARWMAPLWGSNDPQGRHGMPEVILAPNLDVAFKIARSLWPTANGWTCLGRQDPNDPEVCLE